MIVKKNLSFDLSSFTNHSVLHPRKSNILDTSFFEPSDVLFRKSIFPQTTSNTRDSHKKQMTQPTISPNTTKQQPLSPGKRLFSSKRAQEVNISYQMKQPKPPKNVS